MKHLTQFLLITATIFLVSSCKKEDQENENVSIEIPAGSYSGTYQSTSVSSGLTSSIQYSPSILRIDNEHMQLDDWPGGGIYNANTELPISVTSDTILAIENFLWTEVTTYMGGTQSNSTDFRLNANGVYSSADKRISIDFSIDGADPGSSNFQPCTHGKVKITKT